MQKNIKVTSFQAKLLHMYGPILQIEIFLFARRIITSEDLNIRSQLIGQTVWMYEANLSAAVLLSYCVS